MSRKRKTIRHLLKSRVKRYVAAESNGGDWFVYDHLGNTVSPAFTSSYQAHDYARLLNAGGRAYLP